MLENDILELSKKPGRSLDGLEADIWKGVEARVEAGRVSRTIISCQFALLAVALVGSVALGTQTGMGMNPSDVLGVFSTSGNIAPSNRLVGR